MSYRLCLLAGLLFFAFSCGFGKKVVIASGQTANQVERADAKTIGKSNADSKNEEQNQASAVFLPNPSDAKPQLALDEPVDTPLRGVSYVGTGDMHSCAIADKGQVFCWGDNGYGQLGQPGPESNYSVKVNDLGSGTTKLSVGQNHACVLTLVGGIKCWGRNNSGQLGNGKLEPQSLPSDVIGLPSASLSIATGRAHSCTINNTGGVLCWGDNQFGQLGVAISEPKNKPVLVTGLTSGVMEIFAGEDYSCALMQTRSVQCWGSIVTFLDVSIRFRSPDFTFVPATIQGLNGNVKFLALGGSHNCALFIDGKSKCWGTKVKFRGDQFFAETPGDRIASLDSSQSTKDISISAGDGFACSVNDRHEANCWGQNYAGQLGNGEAIQTRLGEVQGLGKNILSISSSAFRSCALTKEGAVYCWGSGPLGGGKFQYARATPGEVNGIGAASVEVSVDAYGACVVTADRKAKCWGRNNTGQIGDGPGAKDFGSLGNGIRSTPSQVTGLFSDVKSIAAGSNHRCALLQSGRVKCWGDNYFGQLNGISTQSISTAPIENQDFPLFNKISTLYAHTCGLTAVGSFYCWGNSGDNPNKVTLRNETLASLQALGLSSDLLGIAPGFANNCVLTKNRAVKCWQGFGYDAPKLFQISKAAQTIKSIEVSFQQICLIDSNDKLLCWKQELFANDDFVKILTRAPEEIPGIEEGVKSVKLGYDFGCALTLTGNVKCWGKGNYGQLGNGAKLDSLSAVSVSGLNKDIESISAGNSSACAILKGGSVKCWGANFYGQLGDSLLANSFSVVEVMQK